MAAHAPPAPFDPDSEEWETFMIRFRSYLVANDLERASDEKKRALLIGFCGQRTLRLAKGLVAPQSVETMSWAELQKVLKEQFEPTQSRTVLRHEFNSRNQQENESINSYIAELRLAAEKCEFQDLEERLTDRLVCGVKDSFLQQKLLAKPELNWKTAVSIARATETAKRASDSIKKPPKPSSCGIQASLKKDAANKVSEESESETSEEEGVHFQKSQAGKLRRELLCQRCGGKHLSQECRFKDTDCRRCGKIGHLARVCRAKIPLVWSEQLSRKHPEMGRNASKQNPTSNPKHKANLIQVCLNRKKRAKKIKVTLQINEQPCEMEVDTGSALTIISWNKLQQLRPLTKKEELKKQTTIVSDYQGKRIPILGRLAVPVIFKNFKGPLELTVVRGNLPCLLGLEWFQALGLHIEGINRISSTPAAEDYRDLLEEFSELFSAGLGKYKGKPISFNLDPKVTPIRLKPRRVPFALKSKVDEQIDKLVKQGILEPVEHATWETPVVTPVKPDGSLRICGDFKSTINKAMQQSAYPVPVVQHLLHQLGKGNLFAKLDLAQAYQQLPVCPKTAEAQTIVTHRGAFKCTRLQFGVSVAPGLFQSLMERLLAGIPGVVPYFDDILISASSKEELKQRLHAVFSKLQKAGLRLKKEKCQIGKREVEFLGYLIDGKGIHPTKSKTEAVQNAPEPKNQTELQAFLGLLNFYAAFLPHKASVAEPLHRLLDKKSHWQWGQKERRAFQAVKHLLMSNQVLVQFNPNLPVTLACDASPFGVGAVLSHVFPSGREAPIAYYSRTLSSAERNYSQIDKEALALVAGVKKFHEYLYGRQFTLITDHKPLLGLLAGDRPTPPILSPRFTRWTLFLAAYNYSLIHRPGKAISHADALSRCPLPHPVEDPAPAASVFCINQLAPGLIAASDIAKASSKDRTLAQVSCWVGRGWPATPPAEEEFRAYWIRRNELSLLKGCVLWGERVIIPNAIRDKLLKILHEGHPGIVKMKALARSYLWWPKMDNAIEKWVAGCSPCQESRPNTPAAKYREWEKPRGPWSRVHIDFAGPMSGQTFLIVVDAFSKWLEIVKMHSTTAEATIRALKRIFATHGLPDVLVSDNGPQFINNVFEEFLADQGIRHALVAPYHAQSNGQAEAFVKVAKDALKRIAAGGWQDRIDEFLLIQHITPNTSTGKSPAELLMGRRLRNKLDRIHPDYIQEKLEENDQKRKEFQVGDKVYVRNYGEGPFWVPGEITAITGPRSYRLLAPNGQIWKRHWDQVRKREDLGLEDSPRDDIIESDGDDTEEESTAVIADGAEAATPGPEVAREQEAEAIIAAPPPLQSDSREEPVLRRSTRQSKRPSYLQDYILK